MPVDIPQLDIPEIKEAVEWAASWNGDSDTVSILDVVTLMVAARAVVEAPTIEWCIEHLSNSIREPGDEDGFDCVATHLLAGVKPCVVKPMLLVDPGSQP